MWFFNIVDFKKFCRPFILGEKIGFGDVVSQNIRDDSLSIALGWIQEAAGGERMQIWFNLAATAIGKRRRGTSLSSKLWPTRCEWRTSTPTILCPFFALFRRQRRPVSTATLTGGQESLVSVTLTSPKTCWQRCWRHTEEKASPTINQPGPAVLKSSIRLRTLESQNGLPQWMPVMG